MKKSSKYIAGIVAVLALVLILYLISPNRNLGSGDYDEFAKCLTQAGAKMYGAYWCPHCLEQKESFGNSWQYIDYVECADRGSNQQRQVCATAGITGYPTWVFANGQRIEGKASFQQLSSQTSCAIN